MNLIIILFCFSIIILFFFGAVMSFFVIAAGMLSAQITRWHEDQGIVEVEK